jgi:O-antigen ligase
VHNDTPRNPDLTPRSGGYWVPVAALVAIVVALVSPRATPGLLLLLGGSVIGLALAGGHRLVPPPLSALASVLVCFAAYLVVNSIWAVAPLEGISRAILFSLIAFLAMAVAVALPMLRTAEAGPLQRSILLAVAVGAAFLAIEVTFGQPIRRSVTNVLPFLRPPAKHAVIVDGWVDQIHLYTLNRNLGLLNLVLWPSLLLAASTLPRPRAIVAAFALLGLAAAGVFFSEHETSMLALIAGCAVYLAMRVAAPIVRVLVLAAWVGATLLIVPLAGLAHDSGLHQAQWLPKTARNRLVLWNVTATKVADAPLLGIGIGSTKPLDAAAAATAERLDGDDYPQRTGRHAHNIFLQTWYELGAAGAGLLLAMGVLALRRFARLPAATQPYAYASFVSTMVIAAFTWGMWQPWFMAAFGMWAVTLSIAVDAARRSAS